MIMGHLLDGKLDAITTNSTLEMGKKDILHRSCEKCLCMKGRAGGIRTMENSLTYRCHYLLLFPLADGTHHWATNTRLTRKTGLQKDLLTVLEKTRFK